MINIDEKTIEFIKSDKFNETVWLFHLGRAELEIEESTNLDLQFMSSFIEKGKAVWAKYKPKVKQYLCNPDTNTPNDFVSDLIEGDLNRLISTLVSTYNIPIGVAIPLCGFMISIGIGNVCKE